MLVAVYDHQVLVDLFDFDKSECLASIEIPPLWAHPDTHLELRRHGDRKYVLMMRRSRFNESRADQVSPQQAVEFLLRPDVHPTDAILLQDAGLNKSGNGASSRKVRAPIPLTPEGVAILRALRDAAGVLLTYEDLEETADIAHATIALRLPYLLKYRLFHRPMGHKSGVQITERGLSRLAEIENKN